ncbi:hypothetical protein LCGC14_1009270 [marine sediment metagenome]|uniref:NTP pyrophosphohydrolase MazG putative catalytic core domain-containing protein n=1 Tax=marine sediment metagenome TaxID=412755 RepID=A0A0F9R6V5_9ZZZZ
MIDYQDLVMKFMTKHKQYPTFVPSNQVKVLRLRLMMEELGELSVAIHEENLVHIADALADLLYVVFGTAAAYDIPMDEIFQEVHRSNMTKAVLDRFQKGGKVDKSENFQEPNLLPILQRYGA